MDLSGAVAAHAKWKLLFRTAILKKETIDISTIAKDSCCELGQWLYDEGNKKFGTLESFRKLRSKHFVFHREAEKIARLINEKNYLVAETLLKNESVYSKLSNEVAEAINALKKEAKLP